VKNKFEQNQERLTELKESLVDGETYWREGDSKRCFKTYQAIA